MRIRVNEAIAYAQKTKPIKKTDLAKQIWAGSNDHSALTNLSNMNSGRSKTISADAVNTICRVCGVSADFLFGLSDEPNNDIEIEKKKEELNEYTYAMLDTINDMKESINEL